MKGFRTILFNIVGIGSMIATSPMIGLIPIKAQPYLGLTIGVGNLILRTITTTPIGTKEEVVQGNKP